MTNEEIVKRLGMLETERTGAEALWNDIERYVLPLSSGGFFAQTATENGKDWFASREVWDSTAPIGAQRLASYLWASSISPASRWFGIGSRIPKINQDPIARRWSDDTGNRMFDTITASNFALEMASGYLDLVGYGNTCLIQEVADREKWAGFEFAGVPLKESFFEDDYRGRTYRYFRRLMWTPIQIISKFTDPKTGEVKVPERIKELAKGQAADTKLQVVYCIYPRTDKKPMSLAEKVRAALERPFGFKYVLREGCELLGEEGGFYEMPAHVGRWERAVGSRWGFGPSALALPTVKLLNAMQEVMVNAGAKVVDPATLVTERGLLSDLDLGPSGLTTVRSLDDIAPFESKARFDVSEALLNNCQMMVRKFFREDDISMKDSPAMTATEVVQRTELMNRLFGGPVGRIQNDIFDPVIQSTFNEMFRAGQIDQPPDIILEEAAKGSGIQIEYKGPFARAMRTDEVAAIERLGAGVAAMKKMGFEEAGDAFDPAQAIREMADRLAVPASMLRTPQEQAQQKANREQLQQMMAQAEIAKTTGEARRAHAGADEAMMGANGA